MLPTGASKLQGYVAYCEVHHFWLMLHIRKLIAARLC